MDKNLTNEEMLRLTLGASCWTTNDLGGKLPSLRVSDSTSGIRLQGHEPKTPEDYAVETLKPTTCYPSEQTMAQTWDPDLIKRMASALADDAIEHDVDVVLGPGINIKRLPIGGRNFEYFSEDPLLAGTLAASYIDGLQEKHIGATAKHYLANNGELARRGNSSEIDERTLHEIYFRTWKYALVSKPWCVMESYNALNGEWMYRNVPALRYLREGLHFEGLLMSDWEATRNEADAINAGIDLTMPFRYKKEEERKQELQEGKIKEGALKQDAEHVLSLLKKNEEEKKLRHVDLTLEQRDQVAFEVAANGIVLAKNDGVLPLKKEQKIALTGIPCYERIFGGGSAMTEPIKPFVPLEKAFQEGGYSNAHFFYTVVDQYGKTVAVETWDDIKECAEQADVVVLAFGSGQYDQCEGRDREDISLPHDWIIMEKELAAHAKKLVLVVYGGTVFDLTPIEKDMNAILLCGYLGQNQSQATFAVLSGKVNPSGKTAETWPLSLMDVPAMHAKRDYHETVYMEQLKVGYRYFGTDIPVLYPFGYGLSYSHFTYGKLKADVQGNDVVCEVSLKNDSDVAGSEVIEIYAHPRRFLLPRPEEELRAYQKVHLEPGETKTVTLRFAKDELSYYDPDEHRWILEKGDYEIRWNKDAAHIIDKKMIRIQ